MRAVASKKIENYVTRDGVDVFHCGGTKKRQQQEIEKAKEYWKDWKDRSSK